MNYWIRPLIGALIGYCTNFIAVRMLFRPYREIRIFGHRVPFTPGAIPRGKKRLAHAVGEVVSGYLITGEDIKANALAKDTEETVLDGIMQVLKNEIGELLSGLAGSQEEFEKTREKAVDACTAGLIEKITHAGLEERICERGESAIKEKLKHSMIGMFISDETIRSILEPTVAEIMQQIAEHGEKAIRPEVDKTVKELQGNTALELLGKIGLEENEIRERIRILYRNIIKNELPKILDKLDIAKIISNKINEMDVEELEKLVLAVMKKELDAIVNLGALIGFVLGLLNLLF